MELRCHRCSMSLGNGAAPVTLVALFRAPRDVQFPRTHPDEVRRRCQSCGWINIFQPVRSPLALGAAQATY